MFMGDFFRWISGTKKCKNLKDLRAYIKPGDVDGLAHWISQRTWYRADKTLNENWQDVDDAILAGACDCEEKALIAVGVIQSWKGYDCQVLIIGNSNPHKSHAACFYRHGWEWGIIDDYRVTRWTEAGRGISGMVRHLWPLATYWCFCDNRGYIIGDKVFL